MLVWGGKLEPCLCLFHILHCKCIANRDMNTDIFVGLEFSLTVVQDEEERLTARQKDGQMNE